MIALAEVWLTEMLRAIGKIVFQPLFYWSFILIIFTGVRRIRKERANFGIKINDVFAEWSRTWILSVGIGFVISAMMIGIGIVYTYETLIVISIVTILLSIHGKITWLSASYTVGLTYVIVLLAPLLLPYQNMISPDVFTDVNFTAIALMVALFIIVESFLLRIPPTNQSFVSVTKSSRGGSIGQHHLRKLIVLPFFLPVPSGLISPFAAYWPYISIGEETYSLLVFPLIIGFDHVVRSGLPQEAARFMSKRIGLLGFVVLLFAAGSIFVPFLSAVSVVVAIIGREFVLYIFRMREKQTLPYFTELSKGMIVLAVIPGSRADRLGIQVGETIGRVNGKPISSVADFYYRLQENSAFFKLDVYDHQDEVRFVQSAIFEGDHHELGIIFVEENELVLGLGSEKQ